MNPAEPTNWVPAVIALGAALTAAIGFLLFTLRKHAPAAPPPPSEDLEIRYQSLLAALREHTANKHLQQPESWAKEHERLEQDAAAVLRERAGAQHASLKAQARIEKLAAAQAAKATGFFGRNPALKGALVGAGVVGFFVLLGVVLSQESRTRQEGQEMTGKELTRPGAPGTEPAPQEDPQLKAAMFRASQAPDDIDALAGATTQLLRRQMFEDAVALIQRATLLDPYHVPTRTHRAVMTAVQGETGKALKELLHLGNTYQGAYEARLFAGLLAMEANNKPLALEQFELFLAEAPPEEQQPTLLAGIAELRQELGSQQAPAPGP